MWLERFRDVFWVTLFSLIVLAISYLIGAYRKKKYYPGYDCSVFKFYNEGIEGLQMKKADQILAVALVLGFHGTVLGVPSSFILAIIYSISMLF